MNIPSIFRRNEAPEAPEVQVQGEDVVINDNKGEQGNEEYVHVKLPKTKFN